jgi:hypothetical protein
MLTESSNWHHSVIWSEISGFIHPFNHPTVLQGWTCLSALRAVASLAVAQGDHRRQQSPRKQQITSAVTCCNWLPHPLNYRDYSHSTCQLQRKTIWAVNMGSSRGTFLSNCTVPDRSLVPSLCSSEQQCQHHLSINSDNVRVPTSHNSVGLQGLYQGQLYFFSYFYAVFIDCNMSFTVCVALWSDLGFFFFSFSVVYFMCMWNVYCVCDLCTCVLYCHSDIATE